jgi:hypothetical protein
MHLVAMTVFALVVALVFAVVSKDTQSERLRYGAKIFLAFMGIGLALAWAMYPIS